MRPTFERMKGQVRSSEDGTRLVIRSSPRLLAPDWASRIRHAPVGAWLLIVIFLAIGWLHGGDASGVAAAILVLALVFAVPYAAKALNTQVVVTATVVESRDALRRTKRADRSSLVSWTKVRRQIFGPRFALTKVLLCDEHGDPRLTLSWDSYSDRDLDDLRTVLGLQSATETA